MNGYSFTGSMMHLPNTYSEISDCPRFAIRHSKERVYLLLQYKLLSYKMENIYFNIHQKITLNLYCFVPFVCDWTVTAITSLFFYIMLCNEWKALLDSISLKIIPEKFCDYLSPLLNVSLEDRVEDRNTDGK